MLTLQPIREAYLGMLCESAEDKNRRRAIHYIQDNAKALLGRTMADGRTATAELIERDVATNIPNAREMAKAKFMLGAARLYLDAMRRPNDATRELSRLNQIVKVIATSHESEYDHNLNGLSLQQLEQKFGDAVRGNLEADRREVGGRSYDRNAEYEIVKIPDFEIASRYGKYTSWCITHDERMLDSYTNNGLAQFYFCLRRGYETMKPVVGEGCPLDDYGLSMIAVNVNEDGSLKNCTVRWNHDHGGNDNIMDTKQLSELLGVNFYDVFKPRSADEAMAAIRKSAKPDDFADSMGWIYNGQFYYQHDRKRNRVVKMRRCYRGNSLVCIAYDHFYWYDEALGRQVEPLQEVGGDFICRDCDSLTSLKGAPRSVGGYFACSRCHSLTSLEGAPQKVAGGFSCNYCLSLTSLKGAPQSVGGSFDCSKCPSLTSLEGAPQKVGEDFDCSNCPSLTTLEGAPQEVGETFACTDCDSLTSLKGAPQKIGRDFFCSECPSLTSLEGAPQSVGEDFYCSSCQSLTSLKGAPQNVGGSFYCPVCPSLTSLEGAPQSVGGDFICRNCPSLTSLEGAPQKVGGDFYCAYCFSLTTLKGAPQRVGWYFNCRNCPSLTSLRGIPEHIGGKVLSDFD